MRIRVFLRDGEAMRKNVESRGQGDNGRGRHRFDPVAPNCRFVDVIAAKCCCPDEPPMNRIERCWRPSDSGTGVRWNAAPGRGVTPVAGNVVRSREGDFAKPLVLV
jgi:hypothetical protein